jgi:hypothetical protein
MDGPRFHTDEFRKKTTPNALEGDFVRVVFEGTRAQYAKKKDAVERRVEEYRERGVKAKVVFKPVYHHEERIEAATGTKGINMSSLVGKYTESEHVNTEGLDVEQLKKLGRSFLELAR